MKVKLPKEMRGVKFSPVFTIEMNDFDIDLFLPTLFYTILSEGRGKSRRANDPKNIKGYIDTLSTHPTLRGFDTPKGKQVLERLVRTALITTGGIGRASQGEQITSIVPYTLLSHKAGFPTEGNRQRGADIFIYQVLRDNMQKADDRLQETIKEIFGSGVDIGSMPELGGQYNGTSKLDILTHLSIAFLDGFQNTRIGLSREKSVTPACPTLTNELATDLLRFLFAYYKHMPTQAFTYHLLALINFELLHYTLKLVYAINELVQDPEKLPQAMQESLSVSPPQIYLDFTNDARSHSQEISKACVRRDVEALSNYLTSVLRLRLLDNYADKLGRNTQRRAKIQAILDGATSGPLYLQRLLLLQHDPSLQVHIQAQALNDEETIREQNKPLDEEGKPLEDEENLAWLDEVTDTATDDLERVINLLAESQRGDAFKHFISWFYGVGGLKKPHGLLQGSSNSRQSWRYAPSNDLLAVLVQVVAARLMPKGQEQQEVKPIRLQEFLRFVEEHYGILIDRPPDTFRGAEYTAAARDNLRAMLGRLRQMGIFRDLSDDFTVQRLHAPYANTIRKEV